MTGYTYERINKDECALLIVDHQDGLFHIARDIQADQFRTAMLAHAALGKVFKLPTVMTSSTETGPNGPIPREILQMHPDAPLIKRTGEVNAWDSPEFREAVKATGKKQVIVAGITTDVCVTFVALSLLEAGYTVFVNADACGTFDTKTAADANARMRDAGVHVLSFFAVAGELMRDWRNTPGAPEMIPFFDQYLPTFSFVARAHRAAVLDGKLLPGEDA